MYIYIYHVYIITYICTFAHVIPSLSRFTTKSRPTSAQPKADWNLGVACAELGPVSSNLGNLSPTGVQHGAAWARVGAS